MKFTMNSSILGGGGIVKALRLFDKMSIRSYLGGELSIHLSKSLNLLNV